MARLNPADQAEALCIRSEEENIAGVQEALKANKANSTPLGLDLVLPTIVTAPFDPEQTRPFFEEQLIKALLFMGVPEEDLKDEYLKRNQYDEKQYRHLETNIEWDGWQRGVMLGYELWGKKG